MHITENTYPLGWNVNGRGGLDDEDYHFDVVRQLRPKAMQYISNTDLAIRAYDELEGKSIVGYRTFSPTRNRWKDGNPDQYADEIVAGIPPHIYTHTTNEPNASTEAEVQARNDWEAEVIKRIGDKGRRAFVWNFASGSYKLEHIQRGLYDNLLKTTWDYRELMIPCVHEYSAVFVPFTHFHWDVQGLRNRGNVRPELWLYLDHPDGTLAMPDYRTQIRPWYAHHFRFHYLEHRLLDLGLGLIPALVNEDGTDRLQDLEERPENIYDILKDNHGVPVPYENPHGWWSNYKIYEYYFPQWSVDRAVFEQKKWLRINSDPAWIMARLSFLWDNSNGTQEWRKKGFDDSQRREHHQLLIEDSQAYYADLEGEPDPMPIPIPEPRPLPDKVHDLLPYIMGDERLYELEYHFNSDGTQMVQTQRKTPTSAVFYHVKGVFDHPADWEELGFDDEHIIRGTDISPGKNPDTGRFEFYQIEENSLLGVPWMHRFARVGDSLTSKPLVRFRNRDDGSDVPSKKPYIFEHTIQLYAVHDEYIFPNGFGLQNVIELHGYIGDDTELRPNELFEIYFYAQGYGLVGWSDPTKNWRSYIKRDGLPGTLQRRDVPGVFPLNLPDMNTETPMIPFPDIAGAGWINTILSSTGESTNIRSQPMVVFNPTNKLGEIRLNRPVRINKDKAKEQPDGLWYPILYDEDVEATSQTAIYEVQGWVHSDYVTEPQDPNDPKPPSEDYTMAILSLKPDISRWNMRSQPSVQSDSIGVIENEVHHVLINKSKAEQFTDGVWYPILIANDPQEELANREKFTIPGWVRGDGIVIQDYNPTPEPEPEPEPDPEPPKQGNFIDHYMPEFLLSDTELDSLIRIRQWELDMLKHYRDNRSNPNVDGIVVYFPKDNPPPIEAEEASNDTNLSELQQETG